MTQAVACGRACAANLQSRVALRGHPRLVFCGPIRATTEGHLYMSKD
jgi:hypothetical protein